MLRQHYKFYAALIVFSLPDPEGKYQALEKYGIDLTESAHRGKLDPVIGRDDELRRCIQILCRRTIIGEPGVGKTAIAEGWLLVLFFFDGAYVMSFYHIC